MKPWFGAKRDSFQVVAGCVLLLFGPIMANSDGADKSAIEIQRAWARATPPGAQMGAVYLGVRANHGDDRLLGGSTAIADAVEMHEMQMAGGLMKMRPLAQAELPRNQLVKFEPSGKHIMLVGLHTPLVAGSSFSLQLRFAHAAPITVQVKVMKDSPRASE